MVTSQQEPEASNPSPQYDVTQAAAKLQDEVFIKYEDADGKSDAATLAPKPFPPAIPDDIQAARARFNAFCAWVFKELEAIGVSRRLVVDELTGEIKEVLHNVRAEQAEALIPQQVSKSSPQPVPNPDHCHCQSLGIPHVHDERGVTAVNLNA
jgi:hypothetical protein